MFSCLWLPAKTGIFYSKNANLRDDPEWRAGWGIIGMNNVVELLPKLVGALVGFFHPRLDRTDVKICMMRQIIIFIKMAYLLITLFVSPKMLQIIRNIYV